MRHNIPWCQNKSFVQQLEEIPSQQSTSKRTARKLMLALVKWNLCLPVMEKLETPQHFLFEGNVSHT